MNSPSSVVPDPPGQQRDYPSPTKTGTIPLEISGTNKKCETFYFLWGDLDKGVPPLVGLHGGPGSTCRALQPLAHLAQDHGIPVLLYDQIGCGNSTHLPDSKGDTGFWTFDLFIAELENILGYFAITRYFILGQSWGGMLATKFAVRQPPGLQGLILTSTPAVVSWMNESVKQVKSGLPGGCAETLARCEEQGDSSSPEYRAAFLEFLKRAVCRLWPFPQELLDTVKLSGADTTVYSTLYGPSMLKQTGPLKDFDVREELPLITPNNLPGGLLILSGEFDPCGGRVTQPFVDEVKADVKVVKFARSAHMPILEETEDCLLALSAFLLNNLVA